MPCRSVTEIGGQTRYLSTPSFFAGVDAATRPTVADVAMGLLTVHVLARCHCAGISKQSSLIEIFTTREIIQLRRIQIYILFESLAKFSITQQPS